MRLDHIGQRIQSKLAIAEASGCFDDRLDKGSAESHPARGGRDVKAFHLAAAVWLNGPEGNTAERRAGGIPREQQLARGRSVLSRQSGEFRLEILVREIDAERSCVGAEEGGAGRDILGRPYCMDLELRFRHGGLPLNGSAARDSRPWRLYSRASAALARPCAWGWYVMSMGILAAFAVACLILAITPGPNVSLLIANTTAHGLSGGLWTLAGSTTGFSVLVAIAALGMTSVMVFMADWFDVIRWVGAAYLVYLGARQLYMAFRRQSRLVSRAPNGSALYINGLVVSLSNPKVLLFLGAFLPQFVDPAYAPGPQLAVLAAVFVATLAVVDVTYIMLFARARLIFSARYSRWLDGLSGALLLAGGAVLATLRRPT